MQSEPPKLNTNACKPSLNAQRGNLACQKVTQDIHCINQEAGDVKPWIPGVASVACFVTRSLTHGLLELVMDDLGVNSVQVTVHHELVKCGDRHVSHLLHHDVMVLALKVLCLDRVPVAHCAFTTLLAPAR